MTVSNVEASARGISGRSPLRQERRRVRKMRMTVGYTSDRIVDLSLIDID